MSVVRIEQQFRRLVGPLGCIYETNPSATRTWLTRAGAWLRHFISRSKP